MPGRFGRYKGLNGSGQLQVALVGCGHMGRLHAQVVSRHPECALIAAIDLVPERAAEVALQTGAGVLSEIPDSADVVIVATPTRTHRRLAEPHVRDGRWCFIEKPAAHTADDARALMGPRVLVGHSERHNPALRRGVPDWWRHANIVRTAPSTGRCRDVDVALDLMLHDLDLLLASRGGPNVSRVRGTWGADDVLDEVHATLRWDDGSDAQLSASRLGARRERTWTLRGEGRTLRVDLDVPVMAGQADALTAQWQSFVDAVYGRSALPMKSADAAAAVELAARISARAHSGRTGRASE